MDCSVYIFSSITELGDGLATFSALIKLLPNIGILGLFTLALL